MDIKEIEKLIQSGRNTPLTSFPNKPPKVENICRICHLEKAEQQDLIEKIISISERAHRRPVEVSRIVSERLRFGMSLDYALVWTEAILLNSSEEEDNS